MKKKLVKLFCPLMAAGLCLTSAASCGNDTPTDSSEQDTYPALDTDNEVFDDFFNIDYNTWGIMNSRWGGSYHGGVIKENVGYTKEGYLVITANGDYYNGPVKDVEGRVGKRTGGAIVTHQAFGPGEFSVRMKALPRFGATTAFWTFWNDGHTLNEHGKVYNSEIDFELNVDTMDTTMCTNWTGVEPGNFDNQKIKSSFYHNDGNWHEYTFKWMTNPKRIDYFVDGVKIASSSSSVPVYAAQANIGVWFASFAGTPDFETDYCLVDWFKYVPYLDQPYEPTPNKDAPPSDEGYPKEPMVLPEKVNLVGNCSFEYPISESQPLNAWYLYPGDEAEVRTLNDVMVENAGRNNTTGAVLQSNDRINQTFSHIYPEYEFDLSAYVKHSASQRGKITIQYFEETENYLGCEDIIIDSDQANFKDNEFYEISKKITIPKECKGKTVKRIKLRFSADAQEGNQIIIDDVKMVHLVKGQ